MAKTARASTAKTHLAAVFGSGGVVVAIDRTPISVFTKGYSAVPYAPRTWLLCASGSLATLAIGHIVVCVPFVLRTTTAALAQLDPALLECSTSLGAGPLYFNSTSSQAGAVHI